MELVNIKAIMDLLKKLNQPVDAEEIAFRMRLSREKVSEQLTKLADVKLLKESNGLYSLASDVKTSTIEAIY